jgi:hypothetical protein
MVGRHIAEHHGIGTDDGMVANHDGTQQLGTCADVDMAAHNRGATCFKRSEGDLLQDEAIGADAGVLVDHHTIGVRQAKAAADLARKRYVRAGDHAPEPVSQHGPTPQ